MSFFVFSSNTNVKGNSVIVSYRNHKQELHRYIFEERDFIHYRGILRIVTLFIGTSWSALTDSKFFTWKLIVFQKNTVQLYSQGLTKIWFGYTLNNKKSTNSNIYVETHILLNCIGWLYKRNYSKLCICCKCHTCQCWFWLCWLVSYQLTYQHVSAFSKSEWSHAINIKSLHYSCMNSR